MKRVYAKTTAAAVGAIAAVAVMTLMSGAQAQGLDAARQMIEEHRAKPVFSAPGPAFDAKSCAAGKRVLTIPVSSANPFTKNIALAMIEAGTEAGVEVTEWENQAQPSQWVQGINFAINEGFDLIDLLGGVDPSVIVPQIQAATGAGIVVKTSHFYDLTQTPHESVDGAVPLSFYKVGQILANWAISQTEGKANVVIIGSDEIVPTAPFVQGIRDTLAANCPDCQEVAYINAPVPEWATKIQPSVQSALLANPDVNYLIPIYDSMSQFVVPAVRVAGKTGQVNIATFNGTPFVIDLIQQGQVEMDVGESLGWIARGILDSHMRTLCGLAEPAELNVPFYIFDSSNANDAGTPADYDRGYGDVHVSGFRTLWALSSSHSDLGTGAPDTSAPALFAEHVSKTFGGEKALSDVAFTVAPREVHGLLGQNGSGKSTLIKILAGFHAPDTGATLQVFGRPVPLPLAPGQFRGLGLAFVHQHLGLMPSLTVLENLMLSELATRAGAYINWARERQRAREVFARFGLDLDPSAKVEDLPQVERALLAIVRAFDDIRGERATHDTPGILFLDEPTPFLPKEGVSQLFGLVRGIVDEGASVIFVSHDVDEVLEITDRATILRDGRVAGTLETANALYADFVELIIGRRIEAFQAEAHDLRGAEVDVAVSGLTGGTVVDLSVNLHRGEVLGLTGLIGSGFDEVPYLLFGASRADSGTLQLQDKAYDLHNMSPQRAMEGGVALLPGDRLGTAGVGDLTLIDNITLPVLSSFHGLTGLKRRAMRRRASELGREFDVRPNVPERELESLSGGNQQKVLLAKWMQTSPSLMLLDEPTQGVDVGARQQVFEAIRDVAEQGAAVICASTDYGQLAAICDRVLIFARGRVVRELVGGDVTKDRIAEQTVLSLALGNQGEAGTAGHSTEQVHG